MQTSLHQYNALLRSFGQIQCITRTARHNLRSVCIPNKYFGSLFTYSLKYIPARITLKFMAKMCYTYSWINIIKILWNLPRKTELKSLKIQVRSPPCEIRHYTVDHVIHVTRTTPWQPKFSPLDSQGLCDKRYCRSVVMRMHSSL